MRQEQPDGSGYAVFENICQSLREGGFQLCLVDSLDIFDPAYWRAEHRRKGFDNNLFFWRPVPPQVEVVNPAEKLIYWHDPRNSWDVIQTERFLRQQGL
jgi:hypothetical protein